jgi:osmotically-inducible protein OsmY
VKSTLEAMQGVDSGQISVSVSQGIVTLVGPVDSPEQHQQIVRRVAQLDGVRQVVDDLQPTRGS